MKYDIKIPIEIPDEWEYKLQEKFLIALPVWIDKLVFDMIEKFNQEKEKSVL